MNILMASDENYVFLLGISLFSLFNTNKELDEINTYIIADNISEESKRKLQTMTDGFGRYLVFLPPPLMDKDIVVKGTLNISTYYRLKMASILPEDIEKVLYLDCDTLIRGHLDEVWNLELKDNLIAGVIDTTGKFARTSIGLPIKSVYVNAGVLLVNIKKWREESIEQQCMDFLEKNNFKVEFNDQGVINRVCNDRILTLSPKYNFMPPYERYSLRNLERIVGKKDFISNDELYETKANPIIIHYAGYAFNRPWFSGSNGRYKCEFDIAAKASGFNITLKSQPKSLKYDIRKFVNRCPDAICMLLNKIIDKAYEMSRK